MSSYLYYVEDKSVLSDPEYDALCKELHDRWEEIDHRHKYLVTKEDLAAGTGYSIKYPTIVEVCARRWFKEHIENTEGNTMKGTTVKPMKPSKPKPASPAKKPMKPVKPKVTSVLPLE